MPTIPQEGISWREFVEKQNPKISTPPTPNPRFYPYNRLGNSGPFPPPNKDAYASDLENAFSFLEGILQPEMYKRFTPVEALKHPFLTIPGEDDDDYLPHPYGEGKCGKYHWIDETDVPCARIGLPLDHEGEIREDSGRVIRLDAGQGIAIGKEPCEFHREAV